MTGIEGHDDAQHGQRTIEAVGNEVAACNAMGTGKPKQEMDPVQHTRVYSNQP